MAIQIDIEPASTIPKPIPWNARVKDWFRLLKIRFLHHHAGPVKPSSNTELYFDWRGTRPIPRQTAENVHPGDVVYLDEELVKSKRGGRIKR
jgi:hypothetical protein